MYTYFMSFLIFLVLMTLNHWGIELYYSDICVVTVFV